MQKFFTSKYQQIKTIYTRYERWLMPTTLLVGFLVDYITFTNIQIEITLILLFIYWLITGGAIAFINFYDAQKISPKLKYLRLFAPLLIQFTFGALLGGSLIFYWFSGAFSISWPFIFIITVLMISNEVLRHYFLKPILQTSLYFFITISLFSIILPFLFHSLSAWLFILAGALSIIVFYLYINFLSFAYDKIKQQKNYFFVSIFAILIVMNLLYFTNIIPPIPLSLREAGLYHNITVSGKSYTMLAESENFWQRLIPTKTLHIKTGSVVYFYTAIFAPPKLNTTIVHHWQYYDEEKKDWISKNKLSFSVNGGRKEGYKGYSWNSKLAAGTWRIYVENQRGQVLGRIKFSIENTTAEPKLQEIIR